MSRMVPDYAKIPADHMLEGVQRWIEHGACGPNSFLWALITNDLRLACEKADGINRELLHAWVGWFYNWAPADCWGSPTKAAAWAEAGGLVGMEARA